MDGKRVQTVAAGAMFVAGLLHFLLVEEHMAHARGAGLFFLLLGAAQVLWAFAYLRSDDRRLAAGGFVGLAVAPLVLYVITRIARAPWSAGPEAIDVVGIATQAMHVLSGAALLVHWRPRVPIAQVRAACGVGLLVAAGAYASAVVAEDVDWLAQAEGPHLHDDHGDGHGDHGVTFGARGVNMVGTVDYYGPPTGADIDAHCRTIAREDADCWIHHLTDLLVAKGSVAAFDELEALAEANSAANSRSHELAHLLGHAAYKAYGYDIALTLGECSYDVFQGCIHGALQSYFDDLSHLGEPLDAAALAGVCSAATTGFESYACNHGVGHGIMMYTNYDLHGSLEMCDLLAGWHPRASCYGGVVMENVVGYFHSLQPDQGSHHHGHDEPPTYWVDEERPAYPCDVVKERYQDACWRMQTSLVLHFNGGDFRKAAAVCDEAGDHNLACYASLGRDAAPYAGYDPARMSRYCSYGDADEQVACVRAFTSGVILQENDLSQGMDLCAKLRAEHQGPCYTETGRQAGNMLARDDAEAFCGQAPTDHVESCRQGI